MREVHCVGRWRKAYDAIGTDFGKRPGFSARLFTQKVVLGVVEDFAGVGFRDARCGFAEGDLNVDFVGEF